MEYAETLIDEIDREYQEADRQACAVEAKADEYMRDQNELACAIESSSEALTTAIALLIMERHENGDVLDAAENVYKIALQLIRAEASLAVH